MLGPLLDVQMSFRMAGAGDSAPCQKWAQREGFVACPKTMAGHWQRICADMQRCISRGRRSTRDMFIRNVRRSGRWFPERSCILEYPIFSFGKMILREHDLRIFCVRGAARMTWHHFFVAEGKSVDARSEDVRSADVTSEYVRSADKELKM